MASFSACNTQTNVSVVSSGSKAHPSSMLCMWLFIRTIGANGMSYLFVHKVMSKNMQFLKVLYSSLVLPSTQNKPLTALRYPGVSVEYGYPIRYLIPVREFCEVSAYHRQQHPICANKSSKQANTSNHNL